MNSRMLAAAAFAKPHFLRLGPCVRTSVRPHNLKEALLPLQNIKSVEMVSSGSNNSSAVIVYLQCGETYQVKGIDMNDVINGMFSLEETSVEPLQSQQ